MKTLNLVGIAAAVLSSWLVTGSLTAETRFTEMVIETPPGSGFADFGTDVALSGDLLMAGSDSNDCENSDEIYAFHREQDSWIEADILSEGSGGVVLDGDLAVLGPESSFTRFTFYLWRFVNGRWSQRREIERFEPSNSFGQARAFEGTTFVTGEPTLSDNSGVFWVYGMELGQVEFRVDGAAGSSLGSNVALDGNRLAVTASGEIHFYTRTNDSWELEDTIKGDPSEFNPGIGNLALDGNTLITGAGGGTFDPGRVAVYELRPEGWGLTQVFKEEFVDDRDRSRHFGRQVALAGDMFVVAAPPSIFVYQHRNGRWTQAAKIEQEDSNTGAAESLALSGRTIVTGRPRPEGPYCDFGFNLGDVVIYMPERDFWLDGPSFLTPGSPTTIEARGLEPNTPVRLLWGQEVGFAPAHTCEGEEIDIEDSSVLLTATADAAGFVRFEFPMPFIAAEREILLQAVGEDCSVSNLLTRRIGANLEGGER